MTEKKDKKADPVQELRDISFDHRRRISYLERKCKEHSALLAFVDETKFRRKLQLMQKNIARVSSRVGAEITRVAVLTEGVRMYPELTHQFLALADLPYQVFDRYQGISMGDWAEIARSGRANELALEFMLDEETEDV